MTFLSRAGFRGGAARVALSAVLAGTVAISADPTVTVAAGPGRPGYWLAASDGGIFAFGDAVFKGSSGGGKLNTPIVGMATTRSGRGYWLAASDGGIFSFGDAAFFGSTGDIKLNQPIVGMASTPGGQGYWLAASDGGVFAFGDARFLGSTGAIKLKNPIVGMASTPSGQGYWLVARDGGIFSFGDAAFFGSTGAIKLNLPMVGMASTPSGQGYWLAASDGGIFSFGDAAFKGSTGAIKLNNPIVGMATTPSGQGYWLVAPDGGIFSFGDARFFGSTGDIKLNGPIVGMARGTDNAAPLPSTREGEPKPSPSPAPTSASPSSEPSSAKGPMFVNGLAGPRASEGKLTMKRPSGTSVGDVMIAGVAEHEVGTATAPEGWTLIRLDFAKGDVWQWVWYRVATASEPSSYVWEVGDKDANGAILTYRGVDTADPVVASAGDPDVSGTTTAIRGLSMNVTVAGTMLVMFAMVEGPTPNPITPPPGFTERTERGVHPSMASSDMLWPRSGATGERVARAEVGGDKVGQIGTIVALRPAARA